MTASGSPLPRAAPRQSGGDAAVEAFAVCRDCGADIAEWRERLIPIYAGNLAPTERGELALHVQREEVCSECGGGRAEVRVEGRYQLQAVSS
jgi:hypothetical protein